jgi:hypothetical protein
VKSSFAAVARNEGFIGKLVGALQVAGDAELDPGCPEFSCTEVIPPSFSVTTVASELDGPLAQAKDPYRLRIDYKPLNKLTKKQAYPVPNISELLATLAGAAWFSAFDALKRYWERLVDEEDRHKTAFITIFGLYQWK